MVESMLVKIPADTYLSVACALDALSLCRLEVCCRWLRARQGATFNPWQNLCLNTFGAVELGVDHSLELFREDHQYWKARCRCLHEAVARIEEEGEGFSARSSVRLQIHRLAKSACGDCNVYIELEIACVACGFAFGLRGERDDMCSVTFCPESGIVQETWLEQLGAPGSFSSIKATFRPVLKPLANDGGSWICGMYLCSGHLAFFRRKVPSSDEAHKRSVCSVSSWESTGAFPGLAWVQGHSVVPHFRGTVAAGISKHIKITRVGGYPPVWPIAACHDATPPALH